ncbi:TPA: amidohydrolase family protein [Candidatus Bathyarchaeota archaeon]|nr:amidohydrolase family protein [Candidatus Bathyarchaeota archaeon]
MTVDLVISNAKLVTPRGIVEGGIAIDGGVIVAVAKDPHLPRADSVIDAKGRPVLPGLLDGHPHTTSPPDTPLTGTRAAARGGFTTLLEMPGYQVPTFTPEQFDEKRRIYERDSYVDFALHGACASGYPRGSLTGMWKLGATGIKFFVSDPGPGWPQTFDGEIIEGFKELAAVDGLALIHAENDQMIKDNTKRLKAEGRKDYASHLDARPPIAEIEAGKRIIEYLKLTGCRGVIVHTGVPETIDYARRARIEGADVYIETCPQYLFLTEDHVKKLGTWAKFAPPARSKETAAEIRGLLAAGQIDTVATDHAPYPKEEKEAGLKDMLAAPNGIPGLETFLPLMLNAVNDGWLTLERLVEVTAENPAKIYRVWPKKGSFTPGADGDVVIVDLKKEVRVSNDDLLTACHWSPYDDWKLKGAPVMSLIRGEVVMEDGEVLAKKGFGKYVPRID